MTTAAPTRPLLRYHGGKWRLAPWIISHFPAHRVYVEPFGGGASVLFHKKPARTEIYNELDREIASLFAVLRDPDLVQQLVLSLWLTPFSRNDYADAYEPASEAVEQARRTLTKSFMGMGSKGIWQRSGFDARTNCEGYLSRLNAFKALPEVVVAFAERMREVVIESCDALALIRRFADRTDTLFYLDPPYLPDTYAAGHIYRHRFLEPDHVALAELLQTVRGPIVLSGYPSPLYDRFYTADGGWIRVEKAALADGGTHRTECLWLRNCAPAQAELAL